MDEKNQTIELNYWTVGIIAAIALVVFLVVYAYGSFGNHQPAAKSILSAPSPADSGAVIKAVDPAKLAADYQAASAKIMADYLSAVSADAGSLAGLSSSAKNRLLDLTLPAQFKDRHLSYVILLGEISSLSGAGKTSEAQAKLSQLKALINQ